MHLFGCGFPGFRTTFLNRQFSPIVNQYIIVLVNHCSQPTDSSQLVSSEAHAGPLQTLRGHATESVRGATGGIRSVVSYALLSVVPVLNKVSRSEESNECAGCIYSHQMIGIPSIYLGPFRITGLLLRQIIFLQVVEFPGRLLSGQV